MAGKERIYPNITREFLQLKPVDDSPEEKLDFIKGKRKRRVTRAAIQHEVDLEKENELFELMRSEEQQVSHMESEGLNSAEIHNLRVNSNESKRIKSLLLQFGIAKLLKQGDWLVNRIYEIPKSMGVLDFSRLLQNISDFQESIAGKDNKLIALDFGCGNGEYSEYIRKEDENRRWEVFGYADCIYFTLNDLLKNLIRDEFSGNEALREFVDVVSTLLIRRMSEDDSDEASSDKKSRIDGLASDINNIREILANLGEYIDLENRKRIKIDQEFLSDSEREISDACIELINEYFESPGQFLKKHFKKEALGLSKEEKIRLGEIDTEIERLQRESRYNSKKITVKIRVLPNANKTRASGEEVSEIKRGNRSYGDVNEHLLNLQNEKLRLHESAPDLSKYISLYPYNIIPARFDDYDEIFPASSVHFAWSFRATSHIDDEEYSKTVKKLAESLAPGGVYLDDGKRESWTRFERLEILSDIQRELGDEFRVRIISDGENANSVLIERAYKNDKEESMYYSDHAEIMSEGKEFIDIDEWKIKLPRLLVKNKIIKVLRGMFADPARWPYQNMHFKNVHPKLDKFVEKEVDTLFWNYLIESDEGLSDDILKLVNGISKKILRVIISELEESESEKNEFVPVNPGTAVQTIPRLTAVKDKYGINTERTFPVELLPRNHDIPNLEQVKRERMELAKCLIDLKEKSGNPPIHLIEFDDCFTNGLTMKTLNSILEDACFIFETDPEELIASSNVKLKEGEYPSLNDPNQIYIIGGSLNSAADRYGRKLTDEFCLPLLKQIESGAPARALGICFGSQSLMQAFGRLKDRQIKTVPGALQYGAFPFKFRQNSANVLGDLTGKNFTGYMTREDYTCIDSLSGLNPDDITPMAYELKESNGQVMINSEITPPVFNLLGGKVTVVQFHPEITLKDPETYEQIKKWTNKNLSLNTSYLLTKDIFDSQFDIKGKDGEGERPWVEEDIGPVLLMKILHNQAKSLIEE
jgi:GMP synthase-like glutamine amidotransferase